MTLPQRLCFAAELSNCNLATCWHIELSILGLLHLSIRIHLTNSCSCSMKFFQLKTTLGLALGESWPLLAQPQKNTDVYKGMLPWESFPFSAQLTNCNVGPCWHVRAQIGACWYAAFSTFDSFNQVLDIKFFQLKITLGLALGESWRLLAQRRKNTDVYKPRPSK